MAGATPLMTGTLVKSPPGLNNVDDKTWPRKWETRYFEVYKLESGGGELLYFESDKKEKLKAKVALGEYRTIIKNIKSANAKRKHVFCLVSDARKLFLSAETAEVAEQWVRMFVKASPHLASSRERNGCWTESDAYSGMPAGSPPPKEGAAAPQFFPKGHSSASGTLADDTSPESNADDNIYYDVNLVKVPQDGSTPTAAAPNTVYVAHSPGFSDADTAAVQPTYAAHSPLVAAPYVQLSPGSRGPAASPAGAAVPRTSPVYQNDPAACPEARSRTISATVAPMYQNDPATSPKARSQSTSATVAPMYQNDPAACPEARSQSLASGSKTQSPSANLVVDLYGVAPRIDDEGDYDELPRLPPKAPREEESAESIYIGIE